MNILLRKNIISILGGLLLLSSAQAEEAGSGWSPKFTINCSNGGLLNFMDKGDDICSSLDGYLDVLDSSFSFGGCSINIGGGGNDCYFKTLKNLCKKNISDGEDYVVNPLRSAINSMNEFDFLKGDGFKSSNRCDDIGSDKTYTTPNKSGFSNKEIYEKTSPEVMLDKHIGLYSSRVDLVRDCMKEKGEKCLEEDIISLPENNVEVEKQIAEAAQTIAQADESSAVDQAAIEVETREKLSECLRKKPKEQELCQKKITEDSDNSPEAGATKAIAKLEMASALELNVLKKSTRGSTYYVYKSQEFIKRLPLQKQHEYASGVARQNAADTLIMSLYSEVIALKKEAIRANYANSEEIAKPYSAQGGIDALMNKYDLHGKGWRGAVGSSNGPDTIKGQ